MSNEYLKYLSERSDIKVYTLRHGLQVIGSAHQVEFDRIVINAPYIIHKDNRLSSLIPCTVVPTVINTDNVLATSIPDLVLKKRYIAAVLLDKINLDTELSTEYSQYLN